MALFGKGIASGMAVTLKHLFRRPVTSCYPEQRETLSRRTRGNEILWQENRCSGCRTCARTCPTGVIHMQISGTGKVPAPCTQNCPAGVDIPRYLDFVRQGRASDALAVIREKIPFPSVCGRVCFHPCETNCQRQNIDRPVSIRVLKRWAAEQAEGNWRRNARSVTPTGLKAAVVGSGPAGLTAAFYLAKQGHAVTVFEALPVAGGMMRVGIPDYRLPKAVLETEIAEIQAAGVEIRLNAPIDSPEALLSSGFRAVFLAVGAHEGIRLGIPGEDLPAVIDCASFLRDVALANPVEIGSRVAVVGGGNAAIDAARVALRLGAGSVDLLYRRSEAEMPANPEEILAAREEAVQMQFLVNPVRLTRTDEGIAVECVRMQLGRPDAGGRRSTEALPNSEFTQVFDTVIAAVGQRPLIPPGFKVRQERGRLWTGPDNLSTDLPGIFAGGDAQSGPASVIAAIAAGRRAAQEIDLFLGGTGDIAENLAPPAPVEKPLSRTDKNCGRVKPPELAAETRVAGFAEVEQDLDAQQAAAEAARCLKCQLAYTVNNISVDMGSCIFCGLCVEACPRDALFLGLGIERATYRLSELKLEKPDLALTGNKQPGGYCRPNIEQTLPEQTLLLHRDRRKVKPERLES